MGQQRLSDEAGQRWRALLNRYLPDYQYRGAGYSEEFNVVPGRVLYPVDFKVMHGVFDPPDDARQLSLPGFESFYRRQLDLTVVTHTAAHTVPDVTLVVQGDLDRTISRFQNSLPHMPSKRNVGRPKGSTAWAEAHWHEQYRERIGTYKHRHVGAPLHWFQIATEVGLCEETTHKYYAKWGPAPGCPGIGE